MKTIATFLTVMVFTFSALAEGNSAYEKAMGDALKQMKTSRTIDELTNVANQFQRISGAAESEWLPLYYHAQCYVLMGFNTSVEAKKRDEYLNVAQNSIDAALFLNKNESELYALQSLLHTARMVVDPMSRGQQMMGLSGKAIGQALAINPNNPRAQYLQLSNEVGQAQFFGKDISEYCPRINSLKENWDTLETGGEFYPKWGKNEIEQMAKSCQ
jgi:hypothetical protein